MATDFWENGGFTKVKLPIEIRVGYDVIVDLANPPSNSCPEAWPVISVTTFERLLKAYKNEQEI